MAIYLAVGAAVFIITWLGVGRFRRWSLKRRFLDIPNERSSHANPTPRGGGIVIFVVTTTAFLIFDAANGGRFHWAIHLGAVLVGAISLLDDLRNLSPFVRLLVHALAALAAVADAGGPVLLERGGEPLMFLGLAAAFGWIVWLVNAYNFMDGIDGIAGVQALTAGIGWGIAGFVYGGPEYAFVGGVLGASALGFLRHNWQPARIFMGDVGSAFLGFWFAVLPVWAAFSEPAEISLTLLGAGVSFVWLFVFDTILTFGRRLWRGEKVWQAHREHLYQRMVIAGRRHSAVTLAYGALSMIPLLSVAAGVGLKGYEKIGLLLIGMSIETLLLLLVVRRVTGRTFG